jgi:DNA invertase Pin-like site-specific DNA recombinase
MKAPKTVAYLRVSTLDQAEHGVSLAAQRAKVEAWTSLHDRGELLVFSDSISGKRADNRPGLQAALAALGPGDALVVYSLSRLARSTADALAIAEAIERKGADLVSLSESIDTTSAAGKMVFRMLAVLAEFERDQLAERTSSALQHIRRTGRKTGGSVPYGYDLDEDGRTLVENKREQEVLGRIHDLRREGKSLRAIAAVLNDEGIRSKSGRLWSAKVLLGLLKRGPAPVSETPAAA